MTVANFVYTSLGAAALLIGWFLMAARGYANLMVSFSEVKASISEVKRDVEQMQKQLNNHVDEAHARWGGFNERLTRIENKIT